MNHKGERQMNTQNRALGIELGSTRIKAVAVDEGFRPVSAGDYTWASSFTNGV